MKHSTQHDDVHGWSWEPFAAIFLISTLLVLPAVHLGRGTALFFSGDGWHWPPTNEAFSSIAGVLTGDPYAGLDLTGDASPILAWILGVACVTAGWIIVGIVASVMLRQYRFKGMASRTQAEDLLGAGRLRKNRKVVRPDLYRKAA